MSSSVNDYRQLSYWFDSLGTEITPRAMLASERQVDVAIVGAGYTGLWTAYYLKQQNPQLNIAVVEQEVAGYGASGRNGGWLMGEFAGLGDYLKPLSHAEKTAARALATGMVAEVERVCLQEGIHCDLAREGWLASAARFPAQRARVRRYLDYYRALGFTDDDYCWLDAKEARRLVNIRGTLGGMYARHVAAIHPAKLVRGLADAVERLGVTIYEQSPVTEIQSGRVRTARGGLDADVVVSALEGFSNTLSSPFKRHAIPVVSRVLATEPLSPVQWQAIGFSRRLVCSDASRLVSYMQRSADGRLLFGARGSYDRGGKIRRDAKLLDHELRTQQQLMLDFFPDLQGVAVSHHWCGNLAFSRRMRPAAMFDERSGLALAGGYGGEGVGASNLFGRTLADLILGRESELTAMPWALRGDPNRLLRGWEPEPLPWLAYKAINAVYTWEESLELGRGPRWQLPLARPLAQWCSALL
ncbi:NAD(P)/FAD-dependent oxidoreductase [Microbulbifer pacificus]|uniref:FAD-dependent oxidoreductase n=1 Tax=Microbulbifer pacificus TaxID=407164 RepID=A0AAU0N0W1_9GAMM|nr:FAD-dependent oxidoreductase [Microbulbifer pacificus]WOX06654.1 FAD-dependent oxidoreductase [Microbulbifer pacificus]